MLSAENEALCRRDQAITGLELVLQPSEVLATLKSCGLDNAKLVRLDYLRYKPARRCIGLFEVGWSASDSTLPTFLVATAMTSDSWDKFTSTRAANSVEKGAILVPEKRISLEWFPNDHALKNVSKVMSLDRRNKVLRRVLQVNKIEPMELKTLAYKPARRHVAKGISEGKTLLTLKTYTSSGYADAEWRIRLAMESGLSNCHILGSDFRYTSIATSWIEGQTLSQWLLAPSCSLEVLAKVGSQLAKWHAHGQQFVSRIQSTASRESSDHSLFDLVEDIGILAPAMADRARTLAMQIVTQLNELPKANDLIHGDFYSKQVIIAPSTNHVQFIDFDELRLGDRYEDIANFVAKNYWLAIYEGIDEQRCEAANQLFLEGYAAHYGRIDQARLALRIANEILKCAPHAFRRALPNWTSQIEVLLNIAEKHLKSCGKVASNLQLAPPTEIDRFLDVDLVNRLWSERSSQLDESLQPNSSRVIRAKLVRHKPQRRLLVEYNLAHPGESSSFLRVLGKARLAKGIDARTPQLQKTLESYEWRNSELRVPRVYGLLPSLSMWLQEYVEGDRIYPGVQLKSRPEGSSDHARVGRSLADFHRAKIHLERTHSVTNEVEKLTELFAQLGDSRPELKESLVWIESDCQRLAESLPSSESVPIHRDFYFDQVLISSEHVYLLDLDLAAMGPAELDVGNYLAHLDEYGIRHPSEETDCREMAETFLNSYVERDATICMQAVAIWRHLSLARHIALSARIDGRSHTTLSLLERMRRSAMLYA